MAMKIHRGQDQNVAILVEFSNQPIWSIFFTAESGKCREVQFHSKEQAEAFASRKGLRIVFTEHKPTTE